jgi:hypothetical protein
MEKDVGLSGMTARAVSLKGGSDRLLTPSVMILLTGRFGFSFNEYSEGIEGGAVGMLIKFVRGFGPSTRCPMGDF